MGTEGHAIQPELKPALEDWAKGRLGTNVEPRPINYVMKGQNPCTEMFSVMKAEVELGKLPSEGGFNSELYDHLLSYKKIFIAGQAKSHCVKSSIEDILQKMTAEMKKRVCLLNDCTSNVATPDSLIAGNTLVDEMKKVSNVIDSVNEEDIRKFLDS